MSEEYNGWTNKATWLVKLWIDNDQGEQEEMLSHARWYLTLANEQAKGLANADKLATPEQRARWMLSASLKETFEIRAEPITHKASLSSDLMSWALAMVNWDEIAKSLIEDAAEVPA